MAFDAGSRLGPYEIAGLIGVGGMGEVYRARDTKLGRDVAIKTLPSAFARDADRLARFEREAKLLASLNHAHIAAIYGFDEHEGTRYVAMELVEGETLEQKLRAGELPVEGALRLALQIAEALEAAHEKGVVHRDLKPANVMVTADGRAKVLDFGLAKAFSVDPKATMLAHSPALSLAMTQQGVILGTAGYMSPEQASGQASDQRADIWAFGVVLFEMLAGSPLFSGESVPHILADVLRTEPDWKRLPKNLHPRLRLLLERCLEKSPRNRYHSIADVRVDIEKVLGDPHGLTVRSDPRVARAAPLWRRALPVAGGLIAGAAIVAIAALALRPEQRPRPIVRFATTVGAPTSLPFPAISPDGTRIAFRSGSPSQVFVRRLDDFDARPIPGTEDPSSLLPPCFSPDGTWIAYTSTNNSQLKRAPLAGGAALTIADGLDGADYCDWGEDGYIYFGTNAGIMRIAAAGGRPETVAAWDSAGGALSYERPQLLPGSQRVLFTVLRGGIGTLELAVIDLATHEKKTVLEGAGFARYASTNPGAKRGHLVYGRNGALFAVPFDPRTLEVGPATPVLENVMGVGPFMFASVSDSGTLAYFAGGNTGIGSTLRWIDRSGAFLPLLEPAHLYGDLVLSPDGKSAATSIFDLEKFGSDLWLYDLEGERLTRLTFGGRNSAPRWTPDGRRLIYWHAEGVGIQGGEVRAVPADNSAAPVTLVSVRDAEALPSSISPDGRTVVGTQLRAGGSRDVWSLSLGDVSSESGDQPGSPLHTLLGTAFDERDPALSPDGRFLAYTSNESGRDEVYVVPFAGPGGKTQVSSGGGKLPLWNPNGRELFFANGAQLWAVDVDTTGAFRRLTPRVLFEAPALANPNSGMYSVAPDGSRFLMTTTVGGANPSQLVELRVVVNWFEELNRLAPTR